MAPASPARTNRAILQAVPITTEQDLLNATLIERRDVHESLAIFKVRPDGGRVPPFEPGQYATLGLPIDADDAGSAGSDAADPSSGRPGTRLMRRSYSIASAATIRDHAEFYLVHVDDGRLSRRLWRMRAGDRLYMDPRIKGRFTLTGVPTDRTLVMVATATGLAPFLSMIRTYRGEGRWRRLVLIESCRRARDLAYFDELTEAAENDPTLTYLPTLTREPADSAWAGLRGRVQSLLEPETFKRLTGETLAPPRCHVLLCGNPAMVDQCEAELLTRGFATRSLRQPEGTIHLERYW